MRIAVIGSVLAPYDAISNDLVQKANFLRDVPGWEVSVLAGHNARRDVMAKIVPRVSDLLIAPQFAQADLIIYHFGITYPQFDALLLGNGHARQAVVFHNITPLELAPPAARRTIEKSFAQLGHLHAADAIWADSRENAEMLLDKGVDAGKITIEPLAVDRPARQAMHAKPRGEAIQVAFIGRIVPSKGIQDLVEALALLGAGGVRVQLKVVGDIERADAGFRETLLARIDALGLADRIEFRGMLSDDARDRLLAQSHILAMPSYHEGFCVPVIEALRAGMVPVLYSAHNLRYVADGLCVSAPPGDIAAFAGALRSAVEDVDAILTQADTATLRLERGRMSVADFERAVATHLDQFEPAVRAESLRALVRTLAESPLRSPAP